MDFLGCKRNSRVTRWGKPEYFLQINKMVNRYNIKLNFDINTLQYKSYEELKMIYLELCLQITGHNPYRGKRLQ